MTSTFGSDGFVIMWIYRSRYVNIIPPQMLEIANPAAPSQIAAVGPTSQKHADDMHLIIFCLEFEQTSCVAHDMSFSGEVSPRPPRPYLFNLAVPVLA